MKFSKIRDVKSPNRGTNKSAGIDFYIPNDSNGGKPFSIAPWKGLNIPSGIKCEVPEGYMLCAFNKSGVATKKELLVGACVVDEDYMGEIHIHVINQTPYPVELIPGEKLVQFILVPVFYDTLEEVAEESLFTRVSERGEGGFGSTGIN